MYITIEQYNSVINGLKTQLELKAQEVQECNVTISTLRELRTGDFKENMDLKDRITKLHEQIQRMPGKGLVQKMAKTKKAKKGVTYILEEGHNFFNAKAKSV